jgi:hypothetical protein
MRLNESGSDDHIHVEANGVKIGFLRCGSDGQFRFGFGDPVFDSTDDALDWLANEIAGHPVQDHVLRDVALRLGEAKGGDWCPVFLGGYEVGSTYRGKDGLWTETVTFPGFRFASHLDMLEWLAGEIEGRRR